MRIRQILEITAIEPVDERRCSEVVVRMRQGIRDMVLRAAKPDDSDFFPIDNPSLVKIINRPFKRSHLPRSFLRATVMFHVFARWNFVPYLQNNDVSSSQRLCRKAAVPRAVDPELIS